MKPQQRFAYATATTVVFFVTDLILSILGNNAATKVKPARPIDAAHAPFNPAMYACKIPGNSSAENAALSSDAPTARTLAGSIVGANRGNFLSKMLVKMLWARETEIAPETSW